MPIRLFKSSADRQREFSAVALKHLNAIYNAALYLTKDVEEAEDLVQETYLRAYKFFHLFKKGTNCRAWLFKILQNNFRNRLRSYRREPIKLTIGENKSDESPERELPSTSIPNPKEELTKKDAAEDIMKAINELPEKLRTAVILADIQRLSYQEIAEIMSCPIGTVRSRIARGRMGLRDRLKEHAVNLGYLSPDQLK